MNIIPYFLLSLNSSDTICISFMIIVKQVSVNTLLYVVFCTIECFLISCVNLLLNRIKFSDAQRYTYTEFFVLKKFCFEKYSAPTIMGLKAAKDRY